MADNQNIKGLYETLKREGYTPPEYSRFVADMQNEDNLKGVYKTLQKEGYTPPEYSQFKIDILGDASSTVASATKQAEQAKQAPTAVGQSGGQSSGVVSASTAPAVPSNPTPKVSEQQAPSNSLPSWEATPSVLGTDLVKAVKGGAAAASAPKKASKSGDKIYTFRRGGQDFEVLKSDIDKVGGLSGWEKSHPGAQLRVYMTSPDGVLHHVPTKYVAKRQSEGWSVSAKDYTGWQPSWKEKQSLQNTLGNVQNTLEDFAAATQQVKQPSVITGQKPETLDKTIQRGLERTELQAQIGQMENEVAQFKEKLDKRGQELLDAHNKSEGEKKWWVRAIQAAADASTSGAGRIQTPEDLPEFINDPEYNALKLGLHKSQQALKTLKNASDHKQNGGFWRDFWRGAGDALSDIGAWDFGVSHLKDSVTALNISTRAEKKAPLSTAEQEALGAILDMTGVSQQYGDISRGYRWGNITGTSLTFMKDFILTGGGMGALEGVGAKASLRLAEKAGMKASEEVLKRAASRGLVSFIKKEGLKGVGALLQEQALPWTVKALGVTAEDLLLRAPLMTNTIQGAETLSKIIDKRREGNSWSQAAWEVEADQIIENYSEMFGAHLPGATDMLKAFGARNLTAALLNSTRAGAGGVLGKVSRFMQRAGVNGYFGEVTEEYYGQLWRTMLNLESSKDSAGRNLFLDSDFHGDIWGGMALSVGLTGGGAMSVGYAADGVDILAQKARYYRLKRSVNDIDRKIGDMLGKDVWEPMRGIIDITDNGAMGDLATQIIKDKSLKAPEKYAILDYMETSMVLRGHNMREFLEQRKPFNESAIEYSNAYNEGAAISSREEYVQLIKTLRNANKALRTALHLEDGVDVEDFLLGVYNIDNIWKLPPLVANDKDLSDEERKAILNYINVRVRRESSHKNAQTPQLTDILDRTDKFLDTIIDDSDPINPVVRHATVNATGEEVFILKDADAQSGHVVIRHADGKTEIIAPQDLTTGAVVDKKKERADWRKRARMQYWSEVDTEIADELNAQPQPAESNAQPRPELSELEIGTTLEFPDHNSPMAGATDAMIVEVDDADSTAPRYTIEFTTPDGQRSVASLSREQLAQYGALPAKTNEQTPTSGENSESLQDETVPAAATENTGIPVDEKGRPLYSQAPVEKTIEDLESKSALDNVEFTVESLRKKQRKAVEKEKNTRIDLSDPGDGFEKRAKLQAEREAIDKELAYWEEVWNVVRQRKEEEARKAEPPAGGKGSGNNSGGSATPDSEGVDDASENLNNLHWSDERAANGEPFLIGEDGKIDLLYLPQQVLDRMGISNIPFRLTPTMIAHVYKRHKKELGLRSFEDAVRVILEVMTGFDHVRKQKDGVYIFSIENGRKNASKRAIAFILDYDKGQWLGIKTVGYDRLSNIEKSTVLWEKGENQSSATGVAPVNVTSGQSSQGNETAGIASNQSTVDSEKTPRQLALLDRPNSDQYPTDEELSDRKVNDSVSDKQESEAESSAQLSDNKSEQIVQSTVESATAEVNTSLTEAQKRAGNGTEEIAKISKAKLHAYTDSEGKRNREVYDVAKGLVESSGIEVVEVSDAEASEMLGYKNTPVVDQPNRANEKLTSGSVLLSISGNSSSNRAALKEAFTKLANKTQSAKRKIRNFKNDDFKIDTKSLSTTISGLGKMLSMDTRGGSRYTILQTNGGHTVAIRLSDHAANGNNFSQDNADSNLSIVIERRHFDAKESEIEFTEATIPLATFEARPEEVVKAIVAGVEDVLSDKDFSLDPKLGTVEKRGLYNPRFSIRTYHGTGADFDRFDFSHIGEGEGFQAFGWGGYVTEVEEIGKTYAQDIASTPLLDGKPFDHRQSSREFPSQSIESVLKKFGGDVDRSIEWCEIMQEKWESIPHEDSSLKPVFKEEAAWLRANRDRISMPPRHLYTVEIPDDNGSNYLDWDGHYNIEDLERIASRCEELGVGDLISGEMDEDDEGNVTGYTTGKDIYESLSEICNMYDGAPGDKAVSRMLSKAFVGIKYPADYRNGGRSDEAKNYVIFREKDMEISNHIRFLRDGENRVYGWTVSGKVYLNRDAMNPETPLHEYTHLWDDMVRRENPELWARGKKLLKQTPLWQEVLDDPNYADIRNDEDAVASEVHSRLTGRDGARILSSLIADAKKRGVMETARAVTLVDHLKRWLGDMFRGLKKTLSKWSKQDLEDLTAEEFAHMTLRDLAEGLNPKSGEKTLVAIHNISEENLRKALDLGGFPMPSIAITKAGIGHTGFGGISLVFGKESINPADRYNKVYSGDAWTPTFPETGYKLNSSKTREIYDRANKAGRLPLFRAVDFHPDNYERRIDSRKDDSLVDAFKDDYGAKQLFLSEKGNAVKEYEKRDVEKYSADDINLYEKVLESIGEDRLRGDDSDSLHSDLKRLIGEHSGKDMGTMMSFVAKALVSNTRRKALDYADNGNLKTETDLEATRAKIDERIDPREFQAWLEEMFSGVVEKTGIRNERDMFTPSGESRGWEALYDAVTLDNVVKAMRRQADKGGKGFFGGSIFGAAHRELKNMNDVRREAAERIRSVYDEEIETEKKRLEERLDKITLPSVEGSFSASMDFVENVKDAVVKSHTPEGIYRYLSDIYPDMTMDVAKDISDIVGEIQKMSTRYLEAKPQRAVKLEEVRLAVVPEGTSDEIVRSLESRGISVRTYERGNEHERNAIISRETSERDLRFNAAMSRGRGDFDAIRERAVSERGIVMPGLNEAEVRVVEVPRHDFAGDRPIAQARKWAKENIVGEHSLIDSDGRQIIYSISGKSIEKYLSSSAVDKSDSLGLHLSALTKLPQIIGNSIEAEVHPSYNKGYAGMRGVENGYNDSALIHRFYGAINVDAHLYRVKTTIVEHKDAEADVRTHSYEVTKIEVLPDISENTSIVGAQASTSSREGTLQTAKLLKGVEKSYDPGVKILDASKKASETTLEAGLKDDMTLSQFIDIYRTLDSGNTELDELAERVFAVAGKIEGLKFRMAEPGVFSDHNVMAHYAPGKNAIELNRDAFNSTRFSDAQKAQCILHETIHAVTCWALARYKYSSEEERAEMGEVGEACRDIFTIYEKHVNTDEFRSRLQVNSARGDNAFYGLSDVYEMVAELANPAFRAVLKMKNLWQQVINGVKRILGIDATESGEGHTNALEVLDRALNTLLDNFDPIAYRFYQAHPMKTVHEAAFIPKTGNMEADVAAFNNLRARAIAQHGLVMPGLADTEFPIVEVIPFQFKGSFRKTRDEEIFPSIDKMPRKNGYFVTDSEGKKIEVVLNADTIRKFKNEKSYRNDLQDKSYRVDQKWYFAVFNNFKDVLKGLREVEVHADYIEKGYNGKRDLNGKISDSKLVHRYYGVIGMKDEKDQVMVKMTIYEYRPNSVSMPTIHSQETIAIGNPEHRTHTQEIVQVELLSKTDNSSTPSLLSTNDAKTSSTLQGAKLLQNVEKSYDPGVKILDASKKASEITLEAGPEDDILCRPVTDQETLDKLNSEPTVKVYRAMQLIDGNLYPPMSAKVNGKLRQPTEPNVWEEAEENPDLADAKGTFTLNKGNGKSIKAAYNPYIHTSRSPINDQFSSAWARPELVTVEVEVPVSELNSGYKAEKAKDAVGEKQWKSGPIGRLLAKLGYPRKVILSRWARVTRIVPVEEVADAYAERLNRYGIEVPFNTVPPALREALTERGVKICAPEKGNAGDASRPAFDRWLEDQERLRMGDGKGAYSDEEVSYYNDLISQMYGKNRYTKKQQAKVAQRERRNMMLRLETLAKRMNLDNVEILPDASGLEGKKAKSKGFYNKRTGKITIILANHATMLDAEQTLLHEAVAHYGLRKLFGQNFNTFLANVYDAASDEIRSRITELAARNNWDFRTATEEYLASLAESSNFEHHDLESWWSKIKNLFIDMLSLIGFDDFRDKSDVVLTDNELRYILWRSYQNLVEPGHGANFAQTIRDTAMQYNLKVGEYAESGITAEHVAESDLFSDSTEEDVELYRPGDFTPRDKVIARDVYNRICSTGSYQFREAVQDSMLGLKALYEAVLPGTEIQDVADFENAYLFENRMSSMNKTHQEVYFREILSPLLKEIAKIAGSSAEKRRGLTDYMLAKHGLERNALMRKAAINNSENPDRDFAGLTGLTGEKDWRTAEANAAKWVQDYEAAHNTDPLWAAVNVATKTSLEKLYRCGMLSKEKFEEIRDMYEFYIPLRGWDETTSDEVYGYLTSNNGPLSGSILKKAEGRSSKADDPIATIAMMADSAIIQGHRNLLKQRFLNFVLNHPSDAVSVSRLWLQYNDVNDEWEPIFPNIDSTMSAEQVEAEVEAFEERMAKLKAAEPKKYKRGREAQNIPFKTKKTNLHEHQILVKRNGETFILTINGNPRAAQAINGLTNPDINTSGWIGDVLKTCEWLNRQLSAFYTTRNPDFVVSNFFRDALYSNCMTWVKESPRYALRYNTNFTKLLRPAKLFSMIKKWENGSLDLNDPTEKLFQDFMINGGETGYTSVKDIEGHKRTITAELKRKRNVARNIWRWIGLQLDTLGRSVEICARFAAFKTSIEFGRSIARAVYDAKEVSVNFNKKGSGSTMLHANGQTKAGEVGAYIGGIGRAGFVFFNAGVQGTVNTLRQAKKHPAKFTAGATAMMTLGYLVPVLASMFGGDGDDGDENAYYNLPEYIRRSNVCIRLGKQWLTIPLPIEFRSLYGLGEMAYGVMSGNETYSGSELGYQIASQLSQILPLDFLEGSGGWQIIIPSAFKPMAEAAVNKSWTGLPIYKETPFNENDPEWTKVFKNADANMVAASKWINEQTGGDDYKKGWLDINPAQVEYVLNGYLGGAFSFPSKMWKGLYETPTGQRAFEWKNMPLANRVIKAGDERTAYRKLQEQYFRYAEEYKETTRLLKKYDEAASNGVLGYAEKINFLENSPEFARWEIFDMYAKDMDAYRKAMKDVPDPETLKLMEEEYYQIMREVVDGCRNAEITLKSKRQTNKKRG